jgi:hypothetical protein
MFLINTEEGSLIVYDPRWETIDKKNRSKNASSQNFKGMLA